MALQIQNTWPEMHELISGPHSVFLVVSYCQFLKGLIIPGLEVSIAFDGLFEIYAALAIAAEQEPVRTANFIGVLGGYVISVQ